MFEHFSNPFTPEKPLDPDVAGAVKALFDAKTAEDVRRELGQTPTEPTPAEDFNVDPNFDISVTEQEKHESFLESIELGVRKLSRKYFARFAEFGLPPPALEALEVPPDLTQEHLNAIAEIFGTGNLELSVIPGEEQLTDEYFKAMYPEKQREEDTTRGLTSYNPSHFKNNADADLIGSTEATVETWLSAYQRSIRATVKELQGQLILTESVYKPTYTDGKQQYTTKDGQSDPLLPIIQEVFGEDTNRYDLTHNHWTTELIPKVKEKIIKAFTDKGLTSPNFEIILTPAIVFNQQTTLNHPENSTTSTYEWSDDILLKQDNTDSGFRLMVGRSGLGGAGYVVRDRRGGSWINGGGRLSVVFSKS